MQNMVNKSILADLQNGEHAFVTDIQVAKTELSRCTSLGLTPGAEVTMVQNFGRGPLILKVRGTQIALGRGQARKLFVERFQA
jgi:ferrous iron transport protein A